MQNKTTKTFTKTEMAIILDFLKASNDVLPEGSDKFYPTFFISGSIPPNSFVFKLYHSGITYTNIFDLLELRDYVVAYFNLALNNKSDYIHELWNNTITKHIAKIQAGGLNDN
jgi:hypothetical protein